MCGGSATAYAPKIRNGCTACGSNITRERALPVLAGLRAAQAAGFTHAVQIDADLQHDPSRIGEFVAAAERDPAAVINGVPQYDASVPAVRLHGRRITTVLVWLNTLVAADCRCDVRLSAVPDRAGGCAR